MSEQEAKKTDRLAAAQALIATVNNYYRDTCKGARREYSPIDSGIYLTLQNPVLMLGLWGQHDYAAKFLVAACERASLTVDKSKIGWGLAMDSPSFHYDRLVEARRFIDTERNNLRERARDGEIREISAKLARTFDAHVEQLGLNPNQTRRLMDYMQEASRTLPKDDFRSRLDSSQRGPHSGGGRHSA